MLPLNWLRLFRLTKPAGKARRTRLQVECLEQRDTPTAANLGGALLTSATPVHSPATVANLGGALLTTAVAAQPSATAASQPVVTYQGGGVLPHVQVQALYLGSDWETNSSLRAQTAQLNAFLGTVVNSPYMDMLTKAGYGGGRGTSAPMDLDQLNIDKTQFLQDASSSSSTPSIQGAITSEIKNGNLLSPANNPNVLYVVFVEPGVAIQSGCFNSLTGFLGYHGAFNYPGSGATNAHYAVVAYTGSSVPLPTGTAHNASFSWLDTLDNLTEVASHELAESVTDPNPTSGWNDAARADGEVGDLVSGSTVYLDGYAVQRIADQYGNAMTPQGATSATKMDFVLKADGTFWVRQDVFVGNAPNVVGVGGVGSYPQGWVEAATGVASISDQGVDNIGQAMVDVVFTDGSVREYHAGTASSDPSQQGPWVYLFQASSYGRVQQARAGQGVSYVLTTNGNLYEYTDFNPGTGTGKTFIQLDSSVQSIDAGTDAHGVSMVTEVRTDWFTRAFTFRGHTYYQAYSQSDAYELSDTTGTHLIAWNVQSVSAGQQGNIAYVATGGTAWWYNESTGVSTYEGSGVAAITAGTDQNGNLVLDMLFANGSLSQSDGGGPWTSLAGNVASIGKAHAGVLDVVFAGGNAEAFGNNTWSFLTGDARTAA